MNLFMHFSLTSPHKQESPPRGATLDLWVLHTLHTHRQRSGLQFTVQQNPRLLAKAQQLLYSGQRMK